MGKLRPPHLPERVGLAIGFGFQVVSIVALVATGLGMSNVPFPLIAAAAEAVGMLVLARVVLDYQRELRGLKADVARLKQPDMGELRRRFADCVGTALLAWQDSPIDLELGKEIVNLLHDAVGMGEAAAFDRAVERGRVTRYLVDLTSRSHSLYLSPGFDPQAYRERLAVYLKPKS